MRLPGTTRRKVGMTSNHHAPYVLGYTRATMVNHHAPYVLGYTRATMVGTKSSELARGSKSQKPTPVRIAGCNSPA